MDSVKPPCKRCFLLDETKLRESIDGLLELMPEDKKTSPEVYEKRLDVCADCGSLIKGTCVKCGCYVELRAAKNFKSCPDKLW